MKKISVILVTACLFVAVMGLVFSSSAQAEEGVKRYDAARVVLEHICLHIKPPLEEFPAGSRYGVLSDALASRGITNFQGTDPDELLTVGDMKEIFDAVTFGEAQQYDEERSECPAEILRIFSLDPGANITLADFQTVIKCFPYCDMGTAETYIPAVEGTEIGPPGETPEDPSTLI